MAVDVMGGARRGGSLLTDERFRSNFFQALVVGLLGAFIAFIVHNTATNLEQRGIATGFGFLDQIAGYDIAFSIFIPFDASATHGRIFLIGLVNTFVVSLLGIVMATIIGFIVGVLRLSPNWLISRIAYCYVEATRNVPLLLQILFWYSFLLGLPSVRNAVELGSGFFISNRGIFAPRPIWEPGIGLVPLAFAIALALTWYYRRWAARRQAETGQIAPTLSVSIGLILGLPILAFLIAGAPVTFDYPELQGFNFTGGAVIKPEFFALWFALSVYTGAFIAEIVRSGIQAVSHGQTEAAYALGIRPSWTMRLIIVPQALRVIVPPLTSQYLNLTKNSSLAVAIGYPDLVATFGGTSLNQTGQAIEIIAMVMAVYLGFSLLISAFMNWYNKKIALVER